MFSSGLSFLSASSILSSAMSFVMEKEKIIMLLAALYSLGDSKITKPMNKWICDYCAMGKTNPFKYICVLFPK